MAFRVRDYIDDDIDSGYEDINAWNASQYFWSTQEISGFKALHPSPNIKEQLFQVKEFRRKRTGTFFEVPIQRVHPTVRLGHVHAPDKFSSTISSELENAIAASEAILGIKIDPEAGIAAPYLAQTRERAIELLRELAELFWQATSELIPVPRIGPAMEGSIDLFWELTDLTLLINIPSDPSKEATFFGRRLEKSKMVGVLDRKDVRPRHLTGWLSGCE